MAITEENPGYKWVGTRPIRPDGLEKVTGKAQLKKENKKKQAINKEN